MAKEQVLNELFKEVRRNYELLKKGAEVIHKRGDGTAGMRGVIETLFDNGGMTVPHIAKLKHVSRQHIQSVVDQMITLGWVKTRPNPFHKKSQIVDLTDEGLKNFEKMKSDEIQYMKKLNLDLSIKKIEEVRSTLVSLNEHINQFLNSYKN